MADPFTGEIRLFAGSFAPRDWAFCNGQTIPIEQNPALIRDGDLRVLALAQMRF